MPPFRFPVRARPGASRTSVGGGYDGPHGRALVVAVTAPASGGRANEAVLRAVAEALGVRPGAVRLVGGAGSRDKLICVDTDTLGGRGTHGADPGGLRARLDALLDAEPRPRPGHRRPPRPATPTRADAADGCS